eukprot:6197904-Pleurochrysis_carterae.AAC.3
MSRTSSHSRCSLRLLCSAPLAPNARAGAPLPARVRRVAARAGGRRRRRGRRPGGTALARARVRLCQVAHGTRAAGGSGGPRLHVRVVLPGAAASPSPLLRLPVRLRLCICSASSM